MARKLKTYVHVDGEAYGPDDEVPADVAKKITNPDVWDGAEETTSDAGEAPRRRSAPKA
jgi:hypothetical protein